LDIFWYTDNATDIDANKKRPAHISNSHSLDDIGNPGQLSDSHDDDLQKHSLVDADDTNDNDTASDMDESIDTNDIAIDIIDDDGTNKSVIKVERASGTTAGSDSDHAEDGLAMIEHKVSSAQQLSMNSIALICHLLMYV
jgi:hypothetical protein